MEGGSYRDPFPRAEPVQAWTARGDPNVTKVLAQRIRRMMRSNRLLRRDRPEFVRTRLERFGIVCSYRSHVTCDG